MLNTDICLAYDIEDDNFDDDWRCNEDSDERNECPMLNVNNNQRAAAVQEMLSDGEYSMRLFSSLK